MLTCKNIRRIFKKLFFGRPEHNIQLNHTSVANHRKNLQKVWNNEQHNDIGLERLLRLFLVAVQFVFPGIYIRDWFGRNGLTWKNLAVEMYVVIKTALPLIFLITGIYTNIYIVILSAYFLAETILYVLALIFVSDIFSRPNSYRRSILLLYFNYVEIACAFAVIYGGLHLLNDKARTIVDYLYFSFITSATIGFGDIHPDTGTGKIIVSIQSVIFLVFIILFINFFSSQVEDKEYFNKQKRN